MTIDYPRIPWHADCRAALSRMVRTMRLGEVRIDPRSRLRLEREHVAIGTAKTADHFALFDVSRPQLELVWIARREIGDVTSPDAVPDEQIVEALLRVGFDPVEARIANLSSSARYLRSTPNLPRLVYFDDILCAVRED